MVQCDFRSRQLPLEKPGSVYQTRLFIQCWQDQHPIAIVARNRRYQCTHRWKYTAFQCLEDIRKDCWIHHSRRWESFYFRLRQAYQMAQFYYGMVCPLAAGSPGMVEWDVSRTSFVTPGKQEYYSQIIRCRWSNVNGTLSFYNQCSFISLQQQSILLPKQDSVPLSPYSSA